MCAVGLNQVIGGKAGSKLFGGFSLDALLNLEKQGVKNIVGADGKLQKVKSLLENARLHNNITKNNTVPNNAASKTRAVLTSADTTSIGKTPSLKQLYELRSRGCSTFIDSKGQIYNIESFIRSAELNNNITKNNVLSDVANNMTKN